MASVISFRAAALRNLWVGGLPLFLRALVISYITGLKNTRMFNLNRKKKMRKTSRGKGQKGKNFFDLYSLYILKNLVID